MSKQTLITDISQYEPFGLHILCECYYELPASKISTVGSLNELRASNTEPLYLNVATVLKVGDKAKALGDVNEGDIIHIQNTGTLVLEEKHGIHNDKGFEIVKRELSKIAEYNVNIDKDVKTDAGAAVKVIKEAEAKQILNSKGEAVKPVKQNIFGRDIISLREYIVIIPNNIFGKIK